MSNPVYKIISIRSCPHYSERAMDWFASKWGIDRKEYEKSINDCINNNDNLPQWYLAIDEDDRIIGGCGLIQNDFVDRTDLFPYLCALFIEERARGNAIGARLLENARIDGGRLGFGKLYLCTDHTSYYEKYGWKYLAIGHHPWGETSRIYEAPTNKQPSIEKMSDFFTARVEGYVWTGKEGTIYTCIDGSDIGWGIHALTVAQKESNAIYIKNYLTEKGWSLEAICALLGNMEHESGINPALWQHFNQTGNGHGYGLVQWTPNKYVPERYLEWMGLNATMANELAQKDPKKLMDTQLEYLLIELEPSAGQWGDFRNKLPEIKNMPIEEFIHNSKNYSAYTLAKVFQAYYERTESFQKKRSDDADKWFRFFTNSY